MTSFTTPTDKATTTDKGDTSVTHHAKAPSEGSTMRHGGSRGLFGLVCLCVLGLAVFLGSGASSAGADTACPNEARRAEQGTALPDCRAYEMVTPTDKNDYPLPA